MSKSYEKNGVFGKYIEHYDDKGNKIGESREIDGVFGKYTEHRDRDGRKIGESRDTKGVFGDYTEHRDRDGRKIGESRDINGVLGSYTEHRNQDGRKVGESRDKTGVLGNYTEQKGGFRKSKYTGQNTTASKDGGIQASSVSNANLSYNSSHAYSRRHSSSSSDSKGTLYLISVLILYICPGIGLSLAIENIAKELSNSFGNTILTILLWPLPFLFGCIVALDGGDDSVPFAAWGGLIVGVIIVAIIWKFYSHSQHS